MNTIKIFENEQFGKVRIAMSENNEPFFCLADVCGVIGIANARNVRSRLEEDDVRQMDTIDSLGRNQQVTFITESGLYDVIIRSDSEKAKPFRKWVTSEVLPSIRKHGAYMTNETLEKALTSPDFLIQLATNLKEEKQKRIEAEQKAEVAEQKIQQDAPKVLFADAVSTSHRSCLIAELAKILQQNGVNIGQNRLFSWMRENGYLCQKGDYYNQPTQKSMKLGLFELKQTTINKPDGTMLVTTTTKVTGKGQVYFVNKFLSKIKNKRCEAAPHNSITMDEITTILDSTRPVSDIISDLKEKSVDVPEWSKSLKDYDPSRHKIVTDKFSRKDKIKSDGRVEPASRIHLGLEKLLVKRITEFAFAIPVRRVYHNTEENEKRQQITKAIEAIYKYARIDSENIRRGNAYFASCEIFTIWYVVERPNTLYGFNSKYKLKSKTYSPMDGVRLYPLFDEWGDMIAMSFEYKKKIKDKEVTFFETYTADRHYKWKQQGEASWIAVTDPERIILKKIPGVYAYRPAPVFHGLEHIREEIEYTLSRNSDVIAYNSAPLLKVTGELVGDEDKGEARRLFRLKNGGDIAYVSWTQAIEALKYHVDTLLKLFFMQAQMPDLSFENMKSLGNIGFDARQMILSDAHLKIGDESGAWIEFFERECNVIKEFLKMMNTSWADEIDNIEVEHVITPFIQNDEDALINRCMKGNGGKAIFSQLESIEMAGYSNDPKGTLNQIQKENKADRQARMNNLFEGAE